METEWTSEWTPPPRDRARTELGRAVQCVVCLLSGWLLLIRRTDLAKRLRRIAPAPRTKPAA